MGTQRNQIPSTKISSFQLSYLSCLFIFSLPGLMLSFFPSLFFTHSLLSLYINLFFSLHCSFHWRHVSLPIMVTDSTQVAYGKSSSFFLFSRFFLVRRCAGDAEALSGNPIYCCFSGQKRLPLTVIDSSQICLPQCRDFL